MKSFLLVTTVACLMVVEALAQQPNGPTLDSEYRTVLGAFAAQAEVAIVKGYADLGALVGEGTVGLVCQEYVNLKDGKRCSGIAVSVTDAKQRESKLTAYVDYEKIASLVAGMDSISRGRADATKLSSVDAYYSTPGGLRISVVNDPRGGVHAIVSVMETNAVCRATLSLGQLDQLRTMVLNAKERLDVIR